MKVDKMAYKTITLAILCLQLIQCQAIEHEIFWRNNTGELRNNTDEFELFKLRGRRYCGSQMYNYSESVCCSRVMFHIDLTNLFENHNRMLVPDNITVVYVRNFLSELVAVTVPESNMWFFSRTYIILYEHNRPTAVFKHSERPLVISWRCSDHFEELFTLDFILNGRYSSETKSGRGVLYAWIRYMTNMYDIDFRKESICDIIHGFILNRSNCVTLPLDTDGFSNGQEHDSKFRLVVTSEEISKHYNRCITDKDNMKNDKCNATDAKDNSENNFATCLTVILFLLYTFEVEGCFHDKFDQDRPVECNGDQNSNGRKENGHTCDTLPKEGMIDTTADDSIQDADRPIAGSLLEMMLFYVYFAFTYCKRHLKSMQVTKNRSSDVSNNIRTHGLRTVRHSYILFGWHVTTNVNTSPDDEEKTNDAIDTVETVNVGTGRDVSEYLTPETDQLEVLEATKEGGAAQEDELVCKICYMEEISVVFLPCSHMLACESCSKLLERCAVCRAVIKAMLKAEIK